MMSLLSLYHFCWFWMVLPGLNPTLPSLNPTGVDLTETLASLASYGGSRQLPLRHEPPPLDTAAMGALVREHVAEHHFSGTVLVAREGVVAYQASFGLAYRPANDRIENHYRFGIASVTKLFTSILVLQLVDEGKLRLDQPISDFIEPALIPQAERITLHHLLLHISGLPNEANKLYRHPMEPEAFLKEALRQRSRSTLGTFNYNNLDYLLLGQVIETVAGRPWKQAVQRRILDPLKMEGTGFLAYGDYPSDFAYPYHVTRAGTYRQNPLFYIENFGSAGSMYATATDLLKLDQALYGDRLLTGASRQRLSTSYPEYNYAGYGVWNYVYPFVDPPVRIMERRGGIMGANVVMVRMPEMGLSLIVLSNNDAFNPDSFGDETNLREALIRLMLANREE